MKIKFVSGTLALLLSWTVVSRGAEPSQLQGDEPPGAIVKASKVFLDRYVSFSAAKQSVDRLALLGTHALSFAEAIHANNLTARLNSTQIYVGPESLKPSNKLAEFVFPSFQPQPNSFESDPTYQKNLLALQAAQATGDRVLGGGLAPSGSYLWCVAVLDQDGATGCTGILVTSRLVLTALHCSREIAGGPRQIFIGDRVGDPNGHRYNVVLPPHFPPVVPGTTTQPDIMLLELDKDVLEATPRALVPSNINIADQGYVRVIGFGRDQPPDDQGNPRGTAGVKNVADVPLNGGSGAVLGYNPSYEFCAGIRGLNIDTCNGDSGGPALVYVPAQNSSYVCGAVSRSVNRQAGDTARALCGNGGIYTRVGDFRDWIKQVADAIRTPLPQ